MLSTHPALWGYTNIVSKEMFSLISKVSRADPERWAVLVQAFRVDQWEQIELSRKGSSSLAFLFTRKQMALC